MSNIYDGEFSDWADVQREFEMEEPKPEEVLYADYNRDGYDGSAHIVYRNGDKFYYVYGGHCSCYGLEGQWDPEEYTAELFVAAYEKGSWSDYIPKDVLRRVREFLKDHYHGA